MNFCSNCGARITLHTPPDDDRPRYFCTACHTVHYQNPKMVVGCLAHWHNQVLLCRRAIEPRYDKWTLPAGYLENGESVTQGARRETYEEAHARVTSLEPYALYSLAFVSQVYLFFRARLVDLNFKAGRESLEVQLFTESQIPWDHLAFTVVRETLDHFFHDCTGRQFPFHMGDITPTS